MPCAAPQSSLPNTCADHRNPNRRTRGVKPVGKANGVQRSARHVCRNTERRNSESAAERRGALLGSAQNGCPVNLGAVNRPRRMSHNELLMKAVADFRERRLRCANPHPRIPARSAKSGRLACHSQARDWPAFLASAVIQREATLCPQAVLRRSSPYRPFSGWRDWRRRSG
jgi:hypothetical protein